MSHWNRNISAAPGANQQQNQGHTRPQANNTPVSVDNYQQWTQGQALPQTANNAYQGNHNQTWNQGQAQPQTNNTAYPGNHIQQRNQGQARPQTGYTAYPGNNNQQWIQDQARPQTDNTAYPGNYNQQPPILQTSSTAKGPWQVTWASNVSTQTCQLLILRFSTDPNLSTSKTENTADGVPEAE